MAEKVFEGVLLPNFNIIFKIIKLSPLVELDVNWTPEGVDRVSLLDEDDFLNSSGGNAFSGAVVAEELVADLAQRISSHCVVS